MNKSKRDEARDKYFQWINIGESKLVTPIFEEMFEAGYSAGFAEAQEQVKVLVEALEFYSSMRHPVYKETAHKALEQYRKAVSGE